MPRSAFRRALRRLPDEAFERFVADLWAARGFSTRLEDGRVTADRSGRDRESRVLVVGAPAGSELAGADAVVTRRDPSAADVVEGVDVVTLDDLYELTLYGIDRAAADRLLRRHVGRGVEGSADGDGGALDAARRWAGSSRPALLVVGLAVLLTAGAVAGGFVPTGGAAGASGTAERPVTPAAPPTSTLFAAQDAVGEARGTHQRTATPATCLGTHEGTLEHQLRALMSHDPATNSGIETVWRFGSQSFRWYAGSYAAFNASMHARPFRHLLGAAAIEEDLLAEEDGLARWQVTVRDGVERYVYVFTLEVESVGEDAGCWRTAGLTFRVARTANP